MKRLIILGLVALGLGGALAAALSLGGPAVTISDARARAMTAEASALMLELTMTSTGAPDRLIGIEPKEGRARIMGVEGAPYLPIPAGGQTSLAMDGAHAMLMGLPAAARAHGAVVDATLYFESGTEAKVRAVVEDPNAPPAGLADGEAPARAMDHGATFDPPPDEPQPTLALKTEQRPDGGWRVALQTTEFEFSEALVDGPHRPGVGHAHLYVAGGKIRRLYSPSAEFPPLPPGRHILRVTLNTNDHRSYARDGQPVSVTATLDQR